MLHHLVKKKSDMWHVTFDTWHVTHDTWHMACDMLWRVNILSKFQLPSSYGLWFNISWRLGGKGWRTDWLNHVGVCRTAPATPGLLIIGTRDTCHGAWHLTQDMWQVSYDTWHKGLVNIVLDFRSLAQTVSEQWCFEDWEEKDD